MSKFRHTPGPWVAWFGEPDAEGYITKSGIDTTGRGAGIVEIRVLSETLLTDDLDEWNDTFRGDTTLVAAAPELLAACRKTIDALWHLRGVAPPQMEEAISAVVDAIAKAEGGAA